MFWTILCPVVVVSQVSPGDFDDGVELLQRQFGIHHHLDVDGPVRPPQIQNATNTNLDSIETYLSDLEGRRDDPAGSWSQAEKDVLETLKSALSGQFMQFLADEDAGDQTAYNAKKDIHNVCITHTSNTFENNADVTTVSEAMTKTQAKHELCRKSEKSWNDYTERAVSATSFSVSSATVHEIWNQHDLLATAVSLAKSQAQEYAQLETIGQKRACNLDQAEYEGKWCEWRDAKGNACAALENCIESVDLAGLKTSLQARSVNRRKLWQTLEKLACRIDHLLTTFGVADQSEFSTDDSCDDTALDNLRFVLSLDVPVHTPCAGHGTGGTEPGGTTCSAWIEQEYAWETATHVVPTTCQTDCPTLTWTPAPAPHAGCDTDADGCSVYNAHPADCGEYDLALGITSANCCACGASPGPNPAPGPAPLVNSLPEPQTQWVQRSYGNWVASALGDSCDTACGNIGKSCNSEEPLTLSTPELVLDICNNLWPSNPDGPTSVPAWSSHAGRSYPGAPFMKPSSSQCGHWDDSTPSNRNNLPSGYSCSENIYTTTHSAICYCD